MKPGIEELYRRFCEYRQRTLEARQHLPGLQVPPIPELDVAQFSALWNRSERSPGRHAVWIARLSKNGFDLETNAIRAALENMPRLSIACKNVA